MRLENENDICIKWNKIYFLVCFLLLLFFFCNWRDWLKRTMKRTVSNSRFWSWKWRAWVPFKPLFTLMDIKLTVLNPDKRKLKFYVIKTYFSRGMDTSVFLRTSVNICHFFRPKSAKNIHHWPLLQRVVVEKTAKWSVGKKSKNLK